MLLQHNFPFVEPKSGDISHNKEPRRVLGSVSELPKAQIQGDFKQGTAVAVTILWDSLTVLQKHLKNQGNLIFRKQPKQNKKNIHTLKHRMEQSQQKLNQTKATANKTICTFDLVSITQ